MSATTISLSPEDLEALMRRVVREELASLLASGPRSVLDLWRHQGPDDPAGDMEALEAGLDELREYGDQPDAWMSWEDFEAELDRAEAAGELPR
ncbi:MAG: hypothetical protein GY856_47530 [bacterium]|nr:hypothetical protein [bacterium]